MQMRSALFVPASRPDRFAKALAAGADAVIIDLEDAVAPGQKPEARRAIAEFGRSNPQAQFWVRVNGATTPWFDDDLSLCAALPNATGLFLPKAESAQQVSAAGAASKPIIPIIESARGALSLGEIAAAKGVSRLSFGSLDLMLQLGTTPDTEGATLVLEQLRCNILLNSAAYGLLPPLDGVTPNFEDHVGLGRTAQRVHDMGFGGMLCIHPKQIAVIHAAFASAAPDDVAWARRVIAIAEETGSFAFKLDGKMVDLPVIERARKLVQSSAPQGRVQA